MVEKIAVDEEATKMDFRLLSSFWTFFGLLLGPLCRTIRGLYKAHYYHFFIQLNPIKEMGTLSCTVESLRDPKTAPWRHKPSSRFHFFYLIPFFIAVIILVDCFRIFAQADFKYSLTGMPRLFSHLIFPPEFYPQGDPMMMLAILMQLVVSACLFNNPMLESKYVLYLVEGKFEENSVQIWQGGKLLPPSLSRKLSRYHRRITALFPFLYFIPITVAQQFFAYILAAFYWTGSVHDYLTICLISAFLLYGCFTDLFLITFHYLTVQYLRFKQNYLREEIRKLTAQLKGSLTGKHFPKGRTRNGPQILAFNRTFGRLQEQILELYGEIRGQNRFWSKYLTIYFAVCIPEICILTYGILFLQMGLLGFLFFTFSVVEIILLLILISYQSSMVVYRNVQLHKQCLGFVQLIQMALPFHTRDLLMFNNLAASLKVIPSIAFTLLDHQRINSKLFQMVVMYISITFMNMIEMFRK